LGKSQYLRRAQSMSVENSKNEINKFHSQSQNSERTTSSVNKSIESLKSERVKRKLKRDNKMLPIIQESTLDDDY
jgi:hypothetical protein